MKLEYENYSCCKGYCRAWKCDELNAKRYYGLADTSGEVIVPCKYDEIVPCTYPEIFGSYKKNLLACVKKMHKWGYVDNMGREVLECKFDFAADKFNCGLATVMKDTKWGAIDGSGELIIPIEYHEPLNFFENLAVAKLSDGYGYGVINTYGQFVVNPIYDSCQIMGNNRISVKRYGKYGLIDYEAKEISPCIYDEISPSLSGNVMEFKLGSVSGFMDLNGAIFFHELKDNVEKYDAIGGMMKEFKVDSYGVRTDIKSSLFAVERNGKWGWVDNNSKKLVIPIEYDEYYDVECCNNIVILKKQNYYGGIFRDSGKVAFSFKYKKLLRIYNNTFVIYVNDGYYLIQPGDNIISLRGYSQFEYPNGCRATKYITYRIHRSNLPWQRNTTVKEEGYIDLETGKEISATDAYKINHEKIKNENDRQMKLQQQLQQQYVDDIVEGYKQGRTLYLKRNPKYKADRPVIIFDDVISYKYVIRDQGLGPVDLLYNDDTAPVIKTYSDPESMVEDGWSLD